MELLKIRNPHQGIPELLDRIDHIGVVRDSRDGPVIMFPEPTTVVYEKPMERVVFWAERDTNPFFNLIEALWMMAARRDVKFVEQFVKRMKNYSDDGKNFHAAYGHRWRKNFGKDQLTEIIKNLSANKNCRRQMLGIWDVRKDLGHEGVDLPCNVGATFQIDHDGKLNMVVHNRSNDALLGCLNTNAVHFSILQEYIAVGAEAPIGRYWQVSSNLHIYIRDFEKYKCLAIHADCPYRTISRDPYVADNVLNSESEVVITPVVDTDIKTWEEDLHMWMKNPSKVGLRGQFFLRTATPMIMAHKAYKKGDLKGAIEIIESQMPERSDWKKASKEWLERKKEKQNVMQ
jgi:thymidylate synthase